MTPAYRMKDISFRYGECPVLEVGKLEIASGEIVALAGPNGAGKTTLLHVLAFVESPSHGEVFFFNQKSVRDNIITFRRRVALLLQNPYLFHTTVLKNITWGLRLRGNARPVAREKAINALQNVGLSGFESRDARTLSGGETQRVALARALVLDPDVLLLDEPANHMDRESIDRTLEMVQEINERHGTTVILTTHDIPKVKHIVHRVVHLRHGKVVPSLSENLFSGRLVDHGSVFQTKKISVKLPTPANKGSHISVDPTKIKISTTIPQPTARNTYNGRVVFLTSENSSATIGVDAGERFQVVTNDDASYISDLHLGQNIYIILQSDSISVF